MTGKNVIISTNICKSFTDKRSKKEIVALENINIGIPHGRLTALIGPDGAGKTTFIRMVCGLLPASRGYLAVAGLDLRTARTQARANIGYVAQKFSLYPILTVDENMNFYGGVYGLDDERLRERMTAVKKHFNLAG